MHGTMNIKFSINFIRAIFDISIPVSQERSASLLHGPFVMEIIAIYCEGRVTHIHTLCRREQLFHVRASGAYNRRCF